MFLHRRSSLILVELFLLGHCDHVLSYVLLQKKLIFLGHLASSLCCGRLPCMKHEIKEGVCFSFSLPGKALFLVLMLVPVDRIVEAESC